MLTLFLSNVSLINNVNYRPYVSVRGREHLNVFDSSRMTYRWQLFLSAEQAADTLEKVEEAFGAGHDVKGHWQGRLAADVLHVQLGARELPLGVGLRLDKQHQ